MGEWRIVGGFGIVVAAIIAIARRRIVAVAKLAPFAIITKLSPPPLHWR